MTEEFQPLGERLLVRRDKAETKIGVIDIPVAAQNLPQTGVVISLGAGVNNVALGEKVFFSNYSGTKITLDGEELLLMSLEEILGVIRKK